jgi:hypothetical protein
MNCLSDGQHTSMYHKMTAEATSKIGLKRTGAPDIVL